MRYWFRPLIMVVILFGIATSGYAADKLNAGFIFVVPIGDYGWTHAHNQAREIA
jgi:simple sugar transport system substrate-binding protein